eukprot:2788854-Ditylum_brightwellii.AAC.1
MEWVDQAPPVFKQVKLEEKSKQTIRGVLRSHLQKTALEEWPAMVFVSETLVADINNLNFGWGGDLIYNDCHRGVSIFCAAQKSKTETARLEKKRERLEKATYISPSDIAELEAAPP